MTIQFLPDLKYKIVISNHINSEIYLLSEVAYVPHSSVVIATYNLATGAALICVA